MNDTNNKNMDRREMIINTLLSSIAIAGLTNIPLTLNGNSVEKFDINMPHFDFQQNSLTTNSMTNIKPACFPPALEAYREELRQLYKKQYENEYNVSEKKHLSNGDCISIPTHRNSISECSKIN